MVGPFSPAEQGFARGYGRNSEERVRGKSMSERFLLSLQRTRRRTSGGTHATREKVSGG